VLPLHHSLDITVTKKFLERGKEPLALSQSRYTVELIGELRNGTGIFRVRERIEAFLRVLWSYGFSHPGEWLFYAPGIEAFVITDTCLVIDEAK
jgi:hypothetical protein